MKNKLIIFALLIFTLMDSSCRTRVVTVGGAPPPPRHRWFHHRTREVIIVK